MRITYDELYENMKNTYENESGRTLDKDLPEQKKMQALASELYAVSCYADFAFRQAFVQSATGKYLDMHAALRGLERKQGAQAVGSLTFSLSAAAEEIIEIEQGVYCSAENDPLLQFVTTESGKINIGETFVTVAAQAVESGRKYNADIGEVTVMVNAPTGVEYVTNQSPFKGGMDAETDGMLRERIISNYKLPANGYSVSFIENKINNLDYVTDCKISSSSSAGKINLCVASADALTQEQTDEICACVGFSELVGASVSVTAASEKALDMRIILDCEYLPDSSDELLAEIKEDCAALLDSRQIGREIKLDELREIIFSHEEIKGAEFICTGVTDDIILCGAGEYLYLDELQVEFNEL